MNKDFPRVMKMLRKERGLKQNEAAAQLGVAQALLSHYENGKRECGLDFLVSAANFYGVSVDYILGRTNSRNGTVVFSETLPESTVSESYSGDPAGAEQAADEKAAVFGAVGSGKGDACFLQERLAVEVGREIRGEAAQVAAFGLSFERAVFHSGVAADPAASVRVIESDMTAGDVRIGV